jgi:hypothetical protein
MSLMEIDGPYDGNDQIAPYFAISLRHLNALSVPLRGSEPGLTS